MAKKIMIVDDNKEFLEELKETLVLSGYDVIDIDNALLTLDAAIKTKPDVIMLDLKMPEKSGFQVAYEVKHLLELTHIPIIAMTGFFHDEQIPFLDIYGIKKCIKKPFNPLDAIAQIEAVLDNGS